MIEAIKSWYSEPLHDGMDVKDWALFVGLIIVLCIGWKLILLHLVAED